MAAGVIAVIDNTIARLEALTALTRHGNTLRFTHVAQAGEGEDLSDVRSNSRKFILVLTGSRSLVGFLGQEGEQTSVIQSFDLVVAYPVSRRTLDLFKVAAEDVDLIGRQLMNTGGFNTATTGLERRMVEGYALDLDDAGGTALLTIGVECRYTPDYS